MARPATYPDIKQDYEKIIIVSGDGLVHEVYQGLVSRPEDSNEALKIPIAIIPGIIFYNRIWPNTVAGRRADRELLI